MVNPRIQTIFERRLEEMISAVAKAQRDNEEETSKANRTKEQGGNPPAQGFHKENRLSNRSLT